MDWIDLPKDVMWRATVNAVKEQRVPKMREISALPEELLVSRALPCMKLIWLYRHSVGRSVFYMRI